MVKSVMKLNNNMTRSYMQIRWQQDRFGLLMVNANREKFFLFADKLQELYDHADLYHVLKLRDRKPGRAIGYYAGQVIGTLDKGEETIKIRLYISDPYRDVTFKTVDDCAEPDVYHVGQVFTFPKKEFLRFKDALITMLEQAQQFSDDLRAAEMTPLQQRIGTPNA